MARLHATLAPSSAHRWFKCSASIKAISAVMPRPAGPWAEEGSLAHAFGERFLREREDARDYIGLPVDLDEYDIPQILSEEMAGGVQQYLDFCNDLIDGAPGCEWLVERTVHVPTTASAAGMIFGTTDFALYNPSTRTVEVVDFKYGWQTVEAFRSKQMLIYALGMIATQGWTPRFVRVTIVQPRAYHPEGAIRSYVLPLLELIAFAVELDDAVERVQAGGEYVPGEHCRWCSAAWSCPALRSTVLSPIAKYLTLSGKLFAANLPKPSDMTDDELTDAMNTVRLLTLWGNEVKREAQYRLTAGIPLPGWKLVENQARRKYDPAISEQRIASQLKILGVPKDEVYRRKLITITDAEAHAYKGLRGEKRKAAETAFARLTVRESSGYNIAPADDERPAITAFEDAYSGVKLPGM